MSDKKKTSVVITRETGSGGHALLRFEDGPFRPFQLGYTKLNVIVKHGDEVCAFLREVEGERAKAKKRAKNEEEKERAERAEREKERAERALRATPLFKNIRKLHSNNTLSDMEVLDIVRIAQTGQSAPAEPANEPALLPESTDRVGLVRALAKVCETYSYNGVGTQLGVGGTTVSAWCRALNDDTAKDAWWPNAKRLDEIHLFLQLLQERDPSVIAAMTPVGNNRGRKKTAT